MLIFPALLLRRPRINHSYYKNIDYLFEKEYSRSLEAITTNSFRYCFYVRDIFFTLFPPIARLKLCLHPSERLSFISLLFRFVLFLRPTVASNTTKYLVATDSWCLGYFHWLLDALPRIISYLEIVDDQCVLILPSSHKKHPYIAEMLDLLGVKYISAPPFRALYINHLEYIYPLATSGNYHPRSLALLRDRFSRFIDNTTSFVSSYTSIKDSALDILWISRSKSARRHLVNESDAIKHISDMCNLRIIYPEDLDTNAQIQVFSTAKLIIGIHGAGLSNMIFMPTGSSVLEIRPYDDDANNCFYSLAASLHLNYGFAFARKVSQLSSLQTTDLEIIDFAPLVTEIRRLLADSI